MWTLLLCVAAVAGESLVARWSLLTSTGSRLRVAHPSTLALEILPRHVPPGTLHTRALESADLRYSDSLRLTLVAFGRTHRLHLRPNDHLVHPAARVVHYAPDGTLLRSEPLLRETVLAYEGAVLDEAASAQRLREDAAGGIARPWGDSPIGELGWARIVVHHQGDSTTPPIYEGAFSVLGQVYHIITRDNYLRSKGPHDPRLLDHIDGGLVVFRDADTTSASCAHDSLPLNMRPLVSPLVSPWYDLGLFKRDDVAGSNSTSNFADQIGNTAGCSKTQKIVYMGVAADCTYTAHYGGAPNATTMILSNWNTASSLYKSTFNISLGIVELAIQDQSCPEASPTPNPPWNTPCSDAVTLNDRLSLFSAWRGARGASAGSGAGDAAGLWHLMSGCPTGTEVGVAWLGQVCNTQASGSGSNIVSGTAVSTAGRTEWQVVAHEIGHNFGAIVSTLCLPGPADSFSSTTDSCDSSSQFIMSPVSNDGESTFSPCSIGNICKSPCLPPASTHLFPGSVLAGSVNSTCLQEADTAKQTISLQMCGNGIVEAGEDCDPGVGTNSTCCDSATCKFRQGAVCDPASSACCLDTCQYAPSTRVCRPARDATCDRAEMCSGTSAGCPADQVTENGTSCGTGSLACANGLCTSPDLQCQTVGLSLNLTKACPSRNDRSCQVSCQDPRTPNQCILLQTNLVDGSPCGYGGTCSNGNCQSGSALDTAKAWYTSNLQISIPVTVVVGIIVLSILWALGRCVARCCAGRKQQQQQQRISSWVPPEYNRSPTAGGLQPPPMSYQNGPNRQRHSRGANSWGSPPSPVLPATQLARQQSRGRSADPGRRDSDGSSRDGHARLVRARSHWVDDARYNGPNYRG
ncbi:Reprolysin family zinc metalloprotease [Ceratobasidium theobromae]|uniref:Disintegrin and metalloproteinase domain-containing protein B n=1 Tax=Ceratobasidium theobromae TaxID=1582974 RepID=A0A5N5QP21_9AGAM|nr:Reprolysin family zinc metalloprotease [Ceratobasidium theobromae]